MGTIFPFLPIPSTFRSILPILPFRWEILWSVDCFAGFSFDAPCQELKPWYSSQLSKRKLPDLPVDPLLCQKDAKMPAGAGSNALANWLQIVSDHMGHMRSTQKRGTTPYCSCSINCTFLFRSMFEAGIYVRILGGKKSARVWKKVFGDECTLTHIQPHYHLITFDKIPSASFATWHHHPACLLYFSSATCKTRSGMLKEWHFREILEQRPTKVFVAPS